jgi:hypothetical protein
MNLIAGLPEQPLDERALSIAGGVRLVSPRPRILRAIDPFAWLVPIVLFGLALAALLALYPRAPLAAPAARDEGWVVAANESR